MRKQLNTYGPYLAALSIFLSSRLAMAISIIFAARFVPPNPVPDSWNVPPSWCPYLLRYDSVWYLRILRDGYSYDGNNLVEHPVVFYPLYPLVSRAITFFGISETNALLLVSNLSILIAIPLVFKLIREDYGEAIAFYSVALLSFFPTSMFYSAGYTESLAFLLIIIFFLFLKRERYFLAATCAGLASATRATGLVLLFPLLWELWARFSQERRRWALTTCACMVIATSGLWLYMVYQWSAFNTPLAFFRGYRAWESSNPSSLWKVLTLQPFGRLKEIFHDGPLPNSIDPWIFLLFIFLIIYFRKKLSASYILYALGVLLLPYLTRSGGVIGFQSMMRYMLLAFPVFIVAAGVCKERVWFGSSMIGLLAAMLFMYTALFAQYYWAG